jgi:hypothetical protein
LENARKAVELVLTGHEPYPARAIDRHWTLVASNRAVAPLLVGANAALLRPPVNVLRLSLHPPTSSLFSFSRDSRRMEFTNLLTLEASLSQKELS